MLLVMRLSHFMYRLSICLSVAMLAGYGSALAQGVSTNTARPKLPPHWIGTQTGTGEARWGIQPDPEAPHKPGVLTQSGHATYPICIRDDVNLKDGFVEVSFKPMAGTNDQSGGVIWRVSDKDNYYVCRANALEDNVVLYKTVAGKRSALDVVGRKGGYGVKEKVAPAQWHTLRVEFSGNQFKVSFDGKHLFDVQDSTFTEGGKVGVWTKADSVTMFKGFSYGTLN
jgi:hypothetical protein